MGILDDQWPVDLDPSRVPFQQRTITVLRGMRVWDDMTRLDDLSVDDVAAFWATGPVTVNDIITIGNEAIAWHRTETTVLAEVAKADWARQVWRRDLRFGDLLPRVDATVYDIASSGHHTDQRYLIEVLPKLQRCLDRHAGESRDRALVRYVSANTGQSGERTIGLLRSLRVLEPYLSGSEAGRQLGVSSQRIYQLVGQVRNRIGKAQPPGGAAPWLPQDPDAIPCLLQGHGMGT